MRLAHEPADAAGICCVANHTAGLIQDACGDNRFKEPLALAFIYESAAPQVSLYVIIPFLYPLTITGGSCFVKAYNTSFCSDKYLSILCKLASIVLCLPAVIHFLSQF